MDRKAVFITGAASGIGLATAKRFAREGWLVGLSDIDGPGLKSALAAIGGDNAGFTALHDVRKADEWERALDAFVEAAGGRLDVLVNNAGIALLSMIDTATVSEWKKMIDVNLSSVFYGTQRAVREMRRVGQGGSIINLSSVAGLVGIPGCTAYSATKGGVRLFTKAVAIETARDKIRVNSVHPGVIWTNMQKLALNDNAANAAAIVAAIPYGAMGEPIDIANAVLFLASDEARYITGTEITVDGGMTAQ